MLLCAYRHTSTNVPLCSYAAMRIRSFQLPAIENHSQLASGSYAAMRQSAYITFCFNGEGRLWPSLLFSLSSRSRPLLLASVPSLLFSCSLLPPIDSPPSLLCLTRSRRSLLCHGRLSPFALSRLSSSLWLSAMLSPLASGNREAASLPSFALLLLSSSASPLLCPSLSLRPPLALC